MEGPTIFEELKGLTSKWEALASNFNLPPETVQSLKSDGCSEEDALKEVIRHWMEEAGGETSWDIIIGAVRNINTELAETLKKKYAETKPVEGQGESNEAMDNDDDVVKEKMVENGGETEEVMDEGTCDDHVYSESWSKLTREDIIDRVKGVVYGQAIGDALGLATEFMSKKEAHAYYKKDVLTYQDIVQDFHRSRWDKGDWTDDTDQMLLILLMLIEKNGKVDQLDFATRIHNWMKHGFEELGDIGGMGIGMTVQRTLTRFNFLTEPTEAAKTVWEESGKYLAANGAIMRTSILGTLNFDAIPKVVANTQAIAKVTHADPRCAASCVAVTTAIALMLQGAYDVKKKDQLSALIKRAATEGINLLEHKDQKKEMNKHINSSLSDLKLCDSKTIGYTLKAMGAGFYSLRKGTDFRKTITEVIMEGGDADSNAAVCGALMGCKLGFKSLPEDLLQFKHREWLDKKVDAFLKMTGLIKP